MNCVCGYSVDNDEFIFCPMCGVKLRPSQMSPDERVRTAYPWRERQTLKEVGLALRKIRDEKLYLVYGCTSMREYILERVGLSYRHAHRLMLLADEPSGENKE